MKRTFFTTALFALLLLCGGAAWGQTYSYPPYDFTSVNADGDTLYYRITSSATPYTVAVTRCHDSIYHTLHFPQVAYEAGQPGFVYPVYDYDSLITIPSSVTHDGIEYTVTAIDNEAFYEQKGMHTVILPSTVTIIDTAAFYGSTVEHIAMPNVTHILYGAFTGAPLSSVDIPECIVEIGDLAFSSNHSLRQVDIPSSITVLRRSVFAFCDNLSVVNLPEHLVSIEDMAFYDCPQLKIITIPSEVAYIGTEAFIGGFGTYGVNGYLDTLIMKCEIPPQMYDTIPSFQTNKELLVIVPCHTAETYQTAPIWSNYSNFTYQEDCVGVEDYEKENVQMYPVPCHDVLHVRGDGSRFCRIEIYDMYGALVLADEAQDTETALDVSGLPAGAYAVLVVEDNGQRQHVRMVTKQ